MRHHLLALGLLFAANAGFAETYRWVDSAGRTHFSDSAPSGKPPGVAKAEEQSASANGQPFAVKRAMEAFPVTLYTAADCVDACKQARDLLNGRGVPFSEKMLQQPADFDELKQLVGDVFVPSLKVGSQRVRGIDSAAYHNLLDLAGYPKSAPYGSKPSGGLSK